ncbi:MAG: diacylglycerol kinase family protein [Vicinamibacterales bacterium]
MSGAPPAARVIQAGARVALVVNPASRQGHDRATIDAVSRGLASRYRVDLVEPPSAEEVERTVRASSMAHDAIVVAGGDGTIHRAVCGLDGAPTPLGVVPMGTGNDFARGCGIPLLPDGATRRILDGRTRRLDLVRVNGRVYCTVGLIGVGSASALTVARLTRPGSRMRGAVRLFGDWSYRLAGLAHLLAPRRISEEASVRGGSGERLHAAGPVFAIFLANTGVLGGGLVLPIDADASDGLLDIAVVARMPRLKLLWAFFCFTRGRPVPRGTLSLYRTPRAVIGCAREVPFSADGDLVCRGTRFEVEVMPGALTLVS